MKELTSSQIENFKNNLIKPKNDSIEKFRKNNRIKKADRGYYEYKKNKFYGLKDVRNLFDQYDDEVYEEIKYLFNENGLEYEEIKKLLPVKAKKEYGNVIYGRIEQEGVIEYKAEYNYYEVNYEYENIQKVDYIESSQCFIECEYIVCEIIKDQKVEYCEVIEDQKAEYCEIIEDQKVEITEDQKVEDINMLKSSIIESDAIRKLNLSDDELRVTDMVRGVTNYENLSKGRLIKKNNKLKPSEEPKKIEFENVLD